MLYATYSKKIQDSLAGPVGPALHGGLELPLDPERQGETGKGPSEVAREQMLYILAILLAK